MCVKNISKSIRLSSELYDYICSYRGNGFNEKFENIIMDARNTESERRAALEALDEEIRAKKKLLDESRAVLLELSYNLRWQ